MTSVATTEIYPKLNEMLLNGSFACREIRSFVLELEDFFHGLDPNEGSIENAAQLQRLDLVLQSLEELSLLFQRMASSSPEDLRIDFCRAVQESRLEWIKQAFSEKVTELSVREHSVAKENCTIF